MSVSKTWVPFLSPEHIAGQIRKSRFLGWTVVALAYLILRAIDFAFLALVARRDGQGLGRYLISWDAEWYYAAISDGWPESLPLSELGSPEQTTLAWPPLYPLMVRFVVRVVRVLGVDFTYGLMIAVNLFTGFAAMIALVALFQSSQGRARSIYISIIWASLPASAIFLLGYAEGMFVFFLFLSLFAAIRRRWVWSGIVILLAGLTKSSVAPFSLAIAVAAAFALFRRDADFRQRLGAGTAISLALVSVAAWPAFVGWRLGSLDGYARVQQAWGWSTRPLVDSWKTIASAGVDPTREPFIFVAAITLMIVAAYFIWKSTRVEMVIKVAAVAIPAFWITTGAVAVSTMRFLLPDPALPWLLAKMARTWSGILFMFVILAVGRYLWIAMYVSFKIPYPPP